MGAVGRDGATMMTRAPTTRAPASRPAATAPRLAQVAAPSTPFPSSAPAASVQVPWAVYAALVTWPMLLDRARFTRADLLPLGFGEQTATFRRLLETVEPDAGGGDGAPQVSLPAALWELAQDWLPRVERARMSGLVPFSLAELMALQAAREAWPPPEEGEPA